MENVDPVDEPPKPLSGFRLRWAPQPIERHDPMPQPEPLTEPGDALSLWGDPDEVLEEQFSLPGSWSHVSDDLHEQADDNLYEPESPLDDLTGCSVPRVTDPNSAETGWRQCAFAAVSKRQKVERPKLPWEQPMMSTIFRTGDLWSGTALSGFNDSLEPEPPVVKLNIKRVRRELPDEDIRRVALCKLRDIILQDPLASQLGSSINTMLKGGCQHDMVEQSVSDCFRSKASSTLQKRASSLWRLAKLLRNIGVLNPLRLAEEDLYRALCAMREMGAGATSAQHMLEALFFLDSTIKLLLVDIHAVVSGRCRGVARDMYLTKNPLEQKRPLLAVHVGALEKDIKSMSTPLQCIAGQLLFCIHACCRWKDAQRVKSIYIESGHGESLIHADALSSKTALNAEQKTRFMPYVALGSGVTQTDWGSTWLEAREVPTLRYQATLRDVSDGQTTRCARHHMEQNMKSVLTYSRESYTSLYSKVLMMFKLIRDHSFDPDMSRIDRVVQFSEQPPAEKPGDTTAEAPELVSDSKSSVASECGEAGEEPYRFAGLEDQELTSLFPDFPGVPETSLMVHKTSHLVHAMNEDGFLMCGRMPSINFTGYSTLMEGRDLCEGCAQCRRAFAGRRAETSEP
eukprot:s3081_g9.t1